VATAAPAPVATSADTTVAPVDTGGETAATSCPDGYVDFDGVFPLRICDQGEEVTTLQQALVDRGYDIVVDGLFGPQTQEALIEELGGVGEIATQADLDALTG
jgi:peptidoglycan hydrolase-like protein with peptidoglycan-binding domain